MRGGGGGGGGGAEDAAAGGKGDWPQPPVSGKGSYTYPDGGFYDGDFSASMRHGTGMMIFADGTQYRGGWKMDRRHGAGEELTPEKTTYRGEFDMGVRHGKGVEITAYGDEYNGDWVAGKKSGEGDYFSDGLHYEGEWKDDHREGKGKCVFRNGDLYEGSFRLSLMEGPGTMLTISGCQYVGQWKAGKMDGRGTMIFTNGDCYDGEWVAGRRSGNGMYKAVGGATYVGSWDNGKRHGHGVLTNAVSSSQSFQTSHVAFKVTEGETYDGEWKYGLRHGTGTIHKSGSVVYQGEFLDDLRDGHGDGMLKDGSRYVGSWREGKMHGRGKMYPPGDEQGFEGVWEKGQIKDVVGKTGPENSHLMAAYEKGRDRLLEGPAPHDGLSVWQQERDGDDQRQEGGAREGEEGFDLHDIAEGEELTAAVEGVAAEKGKGDGKLPAIAPAVPVGVTDAQTAGGGGLAEQAGMGRRDEIVALSQRHSVQIKGSFDAEGRYLPPVTYSTMRDWHALNHRFTTERDTRRTQTRSKAIVVPSVQGMSGGKVTKDTRPKLVDSMTAGPGEFSFKRWRQERGLVD